MFDRAHPSLHHRHPLLEIHLTNKLRGLEPRLARIHNPEETLRTLPLPALVRAPRRKASWPLQNLSQIDVMGTLERVA